MLQLNKYKTKQRLKQHVRYKITNYAVCRVVVAPRNGCLCTVKLLPSRPSKPMVMSASIESRSFILLPNAWLHVGQLLLRLWALKLLTGEAFDLRPMYSSEIGFSLRKPCDCNFQVSHSALLHLLQKCALDHRLLSSVITHYMTTCDRTGIFPAGVQHLYMYEFVVELVNF